ncbi:hypothetical protein JCM10450v2_001764 [Rhodotorula kratochvilovae]
MDHSRTNATPADPRGLVRLPEELVDLVCSFVRDFEVEDAVTTLGSLCLTSRQFLSPAHRALLYDPSRILTRREAEHAHLFLSRILRRPELGKQVKRLESLVDLFDDVPALSLDHEAPIAFVNWATCLIRHCPNLEAVAVWPDVEASWIEELDRLHLRHLPVLHHLIVQGRTPEMFYENDISAARSFLGSVHLDRLKSLTLRQLGCLANYATGLRLPVEQLVIEGSDLVLEALNLDFGTIRHLILKPIDPDAFVCESRLNPVLKTFTFHPRAPSPYAWWSYWPIDGWSYFFTHAPALPNLTTVVLHAVDIDLGAFEHMTTVARNLEQIELRDSVWVAYDWTIGLSTSPDDRLVNALHLLPRLRFLHLGTIPAGPERLLDAQVYCRMHGVELEWRTPQVRPSSFGDVNVVAGSVEVDLAGDNAVSTVASRWPYHRRAMCAYGESDAASQSSSSTSSSASLDLPQLHPISRTPSPRLDDNSLASFSAFLARTAADEQVYLAAPADVPHLERGYQAGDEADDDVDGEGYEPWHGWGEACDLAEADRAWEEYDDEGGWECARECWE